MEIISSIEADRSGQFDRFANQVGWPAARKYAHEKRKSESGFADWLVSGETQWIERNLGDVPVTHSS